MMPLVRDSLAIEVKGRSVRRRGPVRRDDCRLLARVGPFDLETPEGEEVRVDGSWKVSCRRTALGGSGSANGEFSRMADAVAFAEGWLQPGWTATITNPQGVQVELEKGKPPEFPPTPGKSKVGVQERGT
jgi:hypothetical protein